MFKDFSNVWTLIAVVLDLKRDAVRVMYVAGRERVVRRPHRGVALLFDNQHFVRCSIIDVELSDLDKQWGIPLATVQQRAAAP